MPDRIAWNEQVVGDRATVTFDGPAMSRSVLLTGLTATGCAAFLAFVVLRNATQPLLHLLPVPLVIAGVLLVWRGLPGAHSGRIEIGAGRFHVVMMSGMAIDVDVPLQAVDYFAGGGDEQAIDRAKPVSPEWDRYRVYVYTHDRRKLTVATFGQPEPALFMAQRLESLVEKVRARARG